jgi:hypothetical protein
MPVCFCACNVTTTTSSRPFKDQSGSWRKSTSFGLNDLEPPLLMMLRSGLPRSETSLSDGSSAQIKPIHAPSTFPWEFANQLGEQVPPHWAMVSDAVTRSTPWTSHPDAVWLVAWCRVVQTVSSPHCRMSYWLWALLEQQLSNLIFQCAGQIPAFQRRYLVSRPISLR